MMDEDDNTPLPSNHTPPRGNMVDDLRSVQESVEKLQIRRTRILLSHDQGGGQKLGQDGLETIRRILGIDMDMDCEMKGKEQQRHVEQADRQFQQQYSGARERNSNTDAYITVSMGPDAFQALAECIEPLMRNAYAHGMAALHPKLSWQFLKTTVKKRNATRVFHVTLAAAIRKIPNTS